MQTPSLAAEMESEVPEHEVLETDSSHPVPDLLPERALDHQLLTRAAERIHFVFALVPRDFTDGRYFGMRTK
jgi:hypothetical protein